MKLKICLMGLLCLFFRVSAQNIVKLKPLKIGEKVPDITVGNLLFYPKSDFTFPDFKDQLVILDFWATSCGSCIARFPENLRLQQEFKDKIRIILVNSTNFKDTKDKVIRYFNVHPAYKKLLSVVEDTKLSELFPHETDPHCVWIKNNMVLAITGADEINEQNITHYLNNDQVSLGVKTDDNISFDYQKPLFVNGNGGDDSAYLYRSILVPYNPRLRAGTYVKYDNEKWVSGYTFVNLTRLGFYEEAYPEFNHFSQNRIIYRVKHPGNYSPDSTSQKWQAENCFIYETEFPPVNKIQARSKMRRDLDEFFHLKLDSETRVVPCLIIRPGDNFRHSPDKGLNMSSVGNGQFVADQTIDNLSRQLNDLSEVPVINESGYTGTIRMAQETSDLSANDLLSLLKKAGLTVIREKRPLSFMVVSEKDTPN